MKAILDLSKKESQDVVEGLIEQMRNDIEPVFNEYYRYCVFSFLYRVHIDRIVVELRVLHAQSDRAFYVSYDFDYKNTIDERAAFVQPAIHRMKEQIDHYLISMNKKVKIIYEKD